MAIVVGSPQQVAGPARQLAFEVARRVATIEAHDVLPVAGRRHDLLGAWHERAKQAPAIDFVDAQHGERIGVPTPDNVQDRFRTCRIPRRVHLTPGTTFQISPAYSRIARSDENQPTLDVLRMAALHQPAASRQRSSTCRCAKR